jgi:hypothetical protein
VRGAHVTGMVEPGILVLNWASVANHVGLFGLVFGGILVAAELNHRCLYVTGDRHRRTFSAQPAYQSRPLDVRSTDGLSN